jgi:4-amino-4-deoxy-L-arabinose transferase-like glycosyltransferase
MFDGVQLIGLDGLILVVTAATIVAVLIVQWRSREAQRSPTGPTTSGIQRPGASTLAAGPASQRRNLQHGLWTSLVASPILAGATLLLGLLLAIAGQRALVSPTSGALAFLTWIIGVLMVALLAASVDLSGIGWGALYRRPVTSVWTWSRFRVALAVWIAITSVILWLETPERAIDEDVWALTILWISSILATVLLAMGIPRSSDLHRARDWLRSNRTELLVIVAIALIAIAPRFLGLSSYPWALSGDEGTFAVTARDASQGEITNPFNSGPWGYPSLLFILQGVPIGLFGDSIAAARALSAILGVGSVIATYALCRHHFGRPTAIGAGVLASAFHFHLFWSRDAQNAAAPMFFVPLALLLLDRGLIERRRGYALGAGIVIGISQFFHPADRILFPLATVYTAYALMHPRPRSYLEFRRQVAAVVPNAAWLTLGALVSHLPLLAYFRAHREAFWSRTDEVSVFASGWLERERDLTGHGSITILWRQLVNAAMLPFETMPRGHFRPEVPFAGWPLVVPLAIGLALVTILFWKRRYFGLALAFWATVAGLALTDGPPQTNRYTTAAPFLALFGALGIAAAGRVAMRLVGLPRRPMLAFAAAVTLLISGWHFYYYFRDPNQIEVYSDVNTQVTNVLARHADALGEVTVYFGGPPRIYYYGFRNLPYIAPDATGINIDEPLTPDSERPVLAGTTLFAFLPERRGELDLVVEWFPGGVIEEHTMENGAPLYTSYVLEGDGS